MSFLNLDKLQVHNDASPMLQWPCGKEDSFICFDL